MNFGLYPGFTPSRAASSASATQQTSLRVVYVPITFTAPLVVSENLNTLLLMDTSSPRTETIFAGSVTEGGTIKFAQWGASQLTIAAGAGVTLRVAGGKLAKTRAQFAEVTLKKLSGISQEWLLTGDLEDAP